MVKQKKIKGQAEEIASAGHGLGQLVGDWWEIQVILPLLQEVAAELGLFLDNREIERAPSCRAGKIKWADYDGNQVDYDYVLELNGSREFKGVPVAFMESFWRRGSRHSKDKARDDTNKLLPMRDTYPTARFLAIAACGEFTEPAKDYVRSRSVDLFFVSKENIISAFKVIDANIDYPDNLPEEEKAKLLADLKRSLTPENSRKVAHKLREVAGHNAFESFKGRIFSALTATPQEIRIHSLQRSAPVVFKAIQEASDFLNGRDQYFPSEVGDTHYEYHVSFSDGSDFMRELKSLDEIKKVNNSLQALTDHMTKVLAKKNK